MSIYADILAEIDAFLDSTGMAATTLGREAVRDGNIVGRLREHRNVTARTIERLREFMRSHGQKAA